MAYKLRFKGWKEIDGDFFFFFYGVVWSKLGRFLWDFLSIQLPRSRFKRIKKSKVQNQWFFFKKKIYRGKISLTLIGMINDDDDK